ncbi:replication restart helicase PriA [Rhodoflexus caldus]|uniref:replication restart helicase PriA n=1 Tax=Rhodoflexus caldus TaxID=2891236 RepID=UPI00202A242B|nr:primosomal protein N' [Rhodoflexus caldus]
MRQTFFADILLPLPLKGTFTYRVPLALNDTIAEGTRVVVQFGQKRILTGIVIRIHENPPRDYQTKMILDLIDRQPIALPLQLQFWEWVSDYYICTWGEVMNVAVPAGLKLSSESRIQLHPALAADDLNPDNFSEKELLLLDALRQNETLGYEEAVKISGNKQIYSLLKSLLQKECILIFEELKEKYKPKTIKKVRLHANWRGKDEASLIELLDRLAKHTKQEALILRYLSLIPWQAEPEQQLNGIPKSTLLTANLSESAYKTLLKNEVLEEFEIIVSRLEELPTGDFQLPQLTDAQSNALQKIISLWDKKQAVLLHGVTGSGKTELYIHLIDQMLQSGNQVLLLLPEIALTTQIVARLRRVFGNRLGVYHSRFSDNERVEVWHGIMDGRFDVIVGVRSSIFLPFSHLGLIIIDEEHDSSYKQYDPAPRYHARDAAMMLAHMHGAKVLLGTATPSLESFYHAAEKRYGYVRLTQRFNDAQLPAIQFINTKHESKAKRMIGEFAPVTLEAIRTTLEAKKQVILFQNRRGYAPHLSCQTCNWVPHCQNCAVSLTFHMHSNELRCHYCGYRENPPHTCRQCGSHEIKTVGYGTEKIEDTVKSLFPDAVVQRMDLDTTRGKYGLQNIIEDFSAHKIDILVGTQMVTKGLDFDHVALVVVFDIDRALYYPDFRAHERVFQILTQVAGRAGRKAAQGTVIIQTGNPHHPILEHVAAHHFEDFYKDELPQRQHYHYPPFTRLIELTVKGESAEEVEKAAQNLAVALRNGLGGNRVLGPQAPPIERIRNQYLRNVLVKIERQGTSLKAMKAYIGTTMDNLIKNKTFKELKVVVDVDPV